MMTVYTTLISVAVLAIVAKCTKSLLRLRRKREAERSPLNPRRGRNF